MYTYEDMDNHEDCICSSVWNAGATPADLTEQPCISCPVCSDGIRTVYKLMVMTGMPKEDVVDTIMKTYGALPTGLEV